MFPTFIFDVASKLPQSFHIGPKAAFLIAFRSRLACTAGIEFIVSKHQEKLDTLRYYKPNPKQALLSSFCATIVFPSLIKA